MDRLHGKIQPYAWGSPTAIPELLGIEPTGEPQAELWLGAHASAPSRLGENGTLDAAIAAAPDALVGDTSVAEYGPRLPYLLKVLAAAQPLSLQAHPTRAGAEEGFAREETAGIARDDAARLYKDDWPKPEALVALSDVEALCGFRDPSETYALFEQLAVPSALDLVAPLQGGGAEAVEEVFGRLLRLTDFEVVDEVTAIAGQIESNDDLGRFARTATELAGFYPGDPGVLAALLMNRVAYGRFRAIYLPAGNLHAYLHGTGIEIMANSDNVLRGGLTPKHIDVDELLSVLDFTPGFAGFIDGVEQGDGVFAYPTPAPEFALWRVEASESAVGLPAEGTGRVVISVEGTVTLQSGDDRLELTQGQAAFVAAADTSVQVFGAGTAFVGAPGLDGSDQMAHTSCAGMGGPEEAAS